MQAVILRFNSPFSARSLKLIKYGSFTAASIMDVIPKLLARFCAYISPFRRSSDVSVGNTSAIRFIADGSLRVPLGSPVIGSLSIIPLNGSFVSLFMPANSSAFVFTNALCPSDISIYIGISSLTSSNSDLLGFAAGNNPAFNPAPTTHPEVFT